MIQKVLLAEHCSVPGACRRSRLPAVSARARGRSCRCWELLGFLDLAKANDILSWIKPFQKELYFWLGFFAFLEMQKCLLKHSIKQHTFLPKKAQKNLNFSSKKGSLRGNVTALCTTVKVMGYKSRGETNLAGGQLWQKNYPNWPEMNSSKKKAGTL